MNSALTILRIADRFVSPDSVSSIEKSGDLKRPIAFVSFFYVFAFLSILPFADQLSASRQISHNITIELVAPEPRKIENIEPAPDPPKILAAVPMVMGTHAIDRPEPNVPAKVVGNRLKARAAENARNTPLPLTAKNPVNAAAAAPVVRIKVTDGSQPVKAPANGANVQSQLPALSSAQARSAIPGTGDSPQGAHGVQAANGSQAGDGGAAGNGRGANGQQIAMAMPQTAHVATALGNIAPYRKDMLLRLAANWHPKKHRQGNIVLVVTISKDGRLLDTQLTSSSGDDKLDEYAMATVGKTEFAPLPDWFKGSQLRLKVELAKVEAIKNDI